MVVTLLVVVRVGVMGSANVWILGGYQSDFARNLDPRGPRLRRSDRRGRRLARSTRGQRRRVRHRRRPRRQRVRPAVHRAGPPRRDAGHRERRPVGHARQPARGGLRVGQRRDPGRDGRPAVRRYDRALVVGVELEKTVPGDTAAQYLGAAAWVGHEGQDAKFMWPHMFDTRRRRVRPRATASTRRTCARIAELNFANARDNPNAQTRDWTVPEPTHRRRRRQPGRRGPAAPLRLQPDHRRRRRASSSSATTGCATTRRLGPSAGSTAGATAPSACGLQQKLDRSRRRPVRHAARPRHGARRVRPRRVTLDDLDGFEMHDCFTPSEYLAIDHIGLTGPGESWKASRTATSRSAAGCRSTPAAG